MSTTTDPIMLTVFEDAVYRALLVTHRQGRSDATARELCDLINSLGLYDVKGIVVRDVQNSTVNGRLSHELSRKGVVVRVPGQRKDSRTQRWGDLWALSSEWAGKAALKLPISRADSGREAGQQVDQSGVNATGAEISTEVMQ